MSNAAILFLAAGVFLLRYGGLRLGKAQQHLTNSSVATLLPIAVLVALITIETLKGVPGEAALPRVIGVFCALVAIALRAPIIVVMLVAIGLTALLRALL